MTDDDDEGSSSSAAAAARASARTLQTTLARGAARAGANAGAKTMARTGAAKASSVGRAAAKASSKVAVGRLPVKMPVKMPVKTVARIADRASVAADVVDAAPDGPRSALRTAYAREGWRGVGRLVGGAAGGFLRSGFLGVVVFEGYDEIASRLTKIASGAPSRTQSMTQTGREQKGREQKGPEKQEKEEEKEKQEEPEELEGTEGPLYVHISAGWLAGAAHGICSAGLDTVSAVTVGTAGTASAAAGAVGSAGSAIPSVNSVWRLVARHGASHAVLFGTYEGSKRGLLAVAASCGIEGSEAEDDGDALVDGDGDCCQEEGCQEEGSNSARSGNGRGRGRGSGSRRVEFGDRGGDNGGGGGHGGDGGDGGVGDIVGRKKEEESIKDDEEEGEVFNHILDVACVAVAGGMAGAGQSIVDATIERIERTQQQHRLLGQPGLRSAAAAVQSQQFHVEFLKELRQLPGRNALFRAVWPAALGFVAFEYGKEFVTDT